MKTTGTRIPVDLTGRQPRWPPDATECFERCMQRALRAPDAWSSAPPEGDPELRAVLADLLHDDPGRILVTTGVRFGAALVVDSRTTVVHERPSFSGTAAVARASGARVQLTDWSRMAKRPRGAAERVVAWVTTPCRNPDGATVRSPEDAWLRAMAAKGVQVVVNEVYRWFAPEAVVPEMSGLTVVGSFAKLGGAGTRLGWLRDDEVDRYTSRQAAPPPLAWQRAWCAALQQGLHETLRTTLCVPASRARARFVDAAALPPDAVSHPNAPFVSVSLERHGELEWSRRLSDRGVAVGLGRHFLAEGPSLRLCFTDVDEAGARRAAGAYLEVREELAA